MSCLYPVKIWVLFKSRRSPGLQTVYHDDKKIPHGMRDAFFETIRPCGSCVECRLQRSAWMATRCVHEAKMHTENSWLTLTYSPENFPSDHSLSTDVMQKFWKKMRKHIFKTTLRHIKHYSAGEYGDGEGQRVRVSPLDGKLVGDNPHYHACLFGYDFPDKKYYKKTVNGDVLYTSKILTKIWGYGHATIGDLNFETAAYTARYTMKKVYGDDSLEFYDGRLPEKSWCSQGLGRTWFDLYYRDVYPCDEIVLRSGRKLMPPPIYDVWLKEIDPKLFEIVQNNRAEKINIEKNNFSLERFFEDGRPVTRTVSDVVRCASLRVGSLDKNR